MGFLSQVFLLGFFSSLASASYEGSCPDGGYWNELTYICYSESDKEYSFLGAIHYCLGDDIDNGPFIGLMPLGKLRHFRNRFKYHDMTERDNDHHFKHGRVFRINGLKSHDGYWREYPSGRKIDFHHYPGFYWKSGHQGDTLIWDSHSNRIYIEEEESKHHALCYRDKREECVHCGGFDLGHECSNAGDCKEGKCYCDKEFRGSLCHIPPPPEKSLVSLTNGPEMMFDLDTQTSCDMAAQLMTDDDRHYSVATYIFDILIICTGDLDGNLVNDCWALRRGSSHWEIHPDIPTGREYAGETNIQYHGKDRFWWVSGGGIHNDQYTAKTDILDKSGYWDDGPDLPDPMSGHCAVQINNCEAAIIGGRRGHSDDSYVTSDKIDIYNFETRTWRQGPKMITERYLQTCVRLLDPESGHPLIIIACGIDDDDDDTETVEVWDTVSNQVYLLPHTCPENQGNERERFSIHESLNDYEAMFATGNAQGATDQIYAFTVEEGFTQIGVFGDTTKRNVGALVPEGFAQCS